MERHGQGSERMVSEKGKGGETTEGDSTQSEDPSDDRREDATDPTSHAAILGVNYDRGKGR